MSRHKALPDTIKKQGGKLTLTSTSLVNFSCGCYMNFCSLKRFIGHHSENGKICLFPALATIATLQPPKSLSSLHWNRMYESRSVY